jgi:FMN-dependent NADH-azoreductase
MWFRFVGITEITDIVVEKTLYGPEVDVEARTKAKQRAVVSAEHF